MQIKIPSFTIKLQFRPFLFQSFKFCVFVVFSGSQSGESSGPDVWTNFSNLYNTIGFSLQKVIKIFFIHLHLRFWQIEKKMSKKSRNIMRNCMNSFALVLHICLESLKTKMIGGFAIQFVRSRRVHWNVYKINLLWHLRYGELLRNREAIK